MEEAETLSQFVFNMWFDVQTPTHQCKPGLLNQPCGEHGDCLRSCSSTGRTRTDGWADPAPAPTQPPTTPCLWAAGQIMRKFTTTPGVYQLRFPGRQLDPPTLTSRNVPKPESPCWWEAAYPLCTVQVNTKLQGTLSKTSVTRGHQVPSKDFYRLKIRLFLNTIIVNGVHFRN